MNMADGKETLTALLGCRCSGNLRTDTLLDIPGYAKLIGSLFSCDCINFFWSSDDANTGETDKKTDPVKAEVNVKGMIYSRMRWDVTIHTWIFLHTVNQRLNNLRIRLRLYISETKPIITMCLIIACCSALNLINTCLQQFQLTLY
jgi:hypothetical protein